MFQFAMIVRVHIILVDLTLMPRVTKHFVDGVEKAKELYYYVIPVLNAFVQV
jgi:hypothetical protein